MVAECNGDARILSGSSKLSQVVVFLHVHYKFGQNSAEQLVRCRVAFKIQGIAIATFSRLC